MHSPTQTKTLKTPTNCPSVSREDGACWSHDVYYDDITPRAANIHLKVPPRRLYLGVLSPSTLPNAAEDEEEMGECGAFQEQINVSLLSKQGLYGHLKHTAKSTVGHDQIRFGALIRAIDKAYASSTWSLTTVDDDYACAALVITGQSILHHLTCFTCCFTLRNVRCIRTICTTHAPSLQRPVGCFPCTLFRVN